MKNIEVTICETYHKTVEIEVPDNYNDNDIKEAFHKQHYDIDELLNKGRDFAIKAGNDKLIDAYDNWYCSESIVVEG